MQISANDLVQGDEQLLSWLQIGLQRNPLLDNAWHLHSGKHRFLPGHIVQPEYERGRQVGEKWEGMDRVDYQGRERRRQLSLEIPGSLFLLGGGQLVPGA